MADVQTPHTDAGNATFMTNGHNLEEFSTENSFIAPSKNDNLLPHMRNGRGLDLRTPCTRNALAERRSLPNGPKHGEFTPLLKSVAKRNLNQGNMVRGIPQTPAFLKDGFTGGGTPVLPGTDPSGIYADETGSLAGADDEGTPMPVVANSSAQSTPLAPSAGCWRGLDGRRQRVDAEGAGECRFTRLAEHAKANRFCRSSTRSKKRTSA